MLSQSLEGGGVGGGGGGGGVIVEGVHVEERKFNQGIGFGAGGGGEQYQEPSAAGLAIIRIQKLYNEEA